MNLKLILLVGALAGLTACSTTKVHTGCSVIGTQESGKIVAECED